MKSDRCETCVFFANGNRFKEGQCRRRSPVASRILSDENAAVFPVVKYEDWCGEFEKSTEV